MRTQLEIEVSMLARDLMDKHELMSWGFQLDYARRRAGYCYYAKQVISLSRHFIEKADAKEILNTLLHEIAHALTPRAGHGCEWRRMALAIGCDGKTRHALGPLVEPAFKGTCPSCGSTTRAHRLGRKRLQVACRKCCKQFNGGEYTERFKFVWRRS